MEKSEFHKQTTLPGSPSTSRVPVPIPKTIGPYTIESLLEKGGMSVLYLGTHPESKQPTTIKVLSEKFLSQPDIVERFLQEAEIIALADHPNIVKLYGHGNWEGGLYIAMEFIQGTSLRQYLLQTPLSLKKALEVTLDIAHALCHLHTHGIIHRDLKPENILINENGTIKVIDFGIAQLLTEKQDTGEYKRLIGTPVYMSPEQRLNPAQLSYPSDIYSLGIITYELVLGKLSHGQLHLSLMPKGLQKILARALQPKPEDRYQDIVDYISDITAYLNSALIDKDKNASDEMNEFTENFRFDDAILSPSAAPQWKHIDFACMRSKPLKIVGAIREHCSHSEEAHTWMAGESSVHTAEGIIYVAVVRGMLKSLWNTETEDEKIVSDLNTLLVHDTMDQIFSMSYISLFPIRQEFRLIQTEISQTWMIAKGSHATRLIDTSFPSLGLNTASEYKAITEKWLPGETVVLLRGIHLTDTPRKPTEFPVNLLNMALEEWSHVSRPEREGVHVLVECLMRRIKIYQMQHHLPAEAITIAAFRNQVNDFSGK